MAEGYLKSLDNKLEIHSAGTEPGKRVHPLAVKVMKEIGIDISQNRPKSVNDFIDENFDYVITVCGDAEKNCPVFTGNVKHRLHIGFDDPAQAKGSEEFILAEFRRIRDEITDSFWNFHIRLQKADGVS